MVSDLQFPGHGFEYWLGTIAQWPWASYLHLYASVTKQYDSVVVKGVAMHSGWEVVVVVVVVVVKCTD